MWTENMGL